MKIHKVPIQFDEPVRTPVTVHQINTELLELAKEHILPLGDSATLISCKSVSDKHIEVIFSHEGVIHKQLVGAK